MRAIKIDPVTRDPVMVGGKFQFVYDIDVVLQNCDQSMRQQLGELPYNQQKGVEYLNNVFNGNPNFQAFEFQARREIQNVDGVIRVQSFDYSLTDGVLSYTAEIKTIYGVDQISGNI